MSLNYRFVEDEWEETLEFSAGKSDENLPVQVETETAYLFRQITGEVYHRYPFSDHGYTSSAIRHYLQYVTPGSTSELGLRSLKHHLIRSLAACLAKIATVRDHVTILEIGSTLGENYRFAKILVKEMDLDLEIDFIGVEYLRDLVQFSRIIHHEDPHFRTITGDASDLSRFPDRSIDLVLNQGVANIVLDQRKAFREIVRVARVAVIMGVHLTLDDEPFYATRDSGQVTFLPTRKSLLECWKPHLPLWDYHLKTDDWTALTTSGSGSERFIGVRAEDTNSVFEYHILGRYPIFPSLEFSCQTIR